MMLLHRFVGVLGIGVNMGHGLLKASFGFCNVICARGAEVLIHKNRKS